MFHLTAYKAEVEKADTSVAAAAVVAENPPPPLCAVRLLENWWEVGRTKEQEAENGDSKRADYLGVC